MEVLTRARDYRIPFSVRVTSDEWSRWPPCNIGALGGVVAGLQKHANATGPDCKQVNVISGTARCCLSWPTISSGLPRWPISLHIESSQTHNQCAHEAHTNTGLGLSVRIDIDR